MITAPFDYEAQVRERQAKKQREAATLRMKVRGVARLLGGRFIEDDERFSHTIELAPTVHLWARRDWQKKDMIHWGVRCPGNSRCSCPSVCTALARPVVAIAADVRRRLVPAAHAACKAAVAGLAPGDRRFAKRFPLPMSALVKRELVNFTAPILDRVDFDFVGSVGENDGLAHDFGWVVNRVSCEPSETVELVGLTRTRRSL